MKKEKIEKYLEEVSQGTDFFFTVEIENGELNLYMQGDNPGNEDWCIPLIIKNPKSKKGII